MVTKITSAKVADPSKTDFYGEDVTDKGYIPRRSRWVYRDNLAIICNYINKVTKICIEMSRVDNYIRKHQSNKESLLEASDRVKKLVRYGDERTISSLIRGARSEK